MYSNVSFMFYTCIKTLVILSGTSGCLLFRFKDLNFRFSHDILTIKNIIELMPPTMIISKLRCKVVNNFDILKESESESQLLNVASSGEAIVLPDYTHSIIASLGVKQRI